MNKEEIINILTINLGMNDYIDVTKYLSDLEEENKKYKEVIDRAIDKLYCWGEVLDADFQEQMLDILKEVG